MTYRKAKSHWVSRVFDKAGEIDPDNAHDWATLAYGFLLGLGLDPELADEYVARFFDEGLL